MYFLFYLYYHHFKVGSLLFFQTEIVCRVNTSLFLLHFFTLFFFFIFSSRSSFLHPNGCAGAFVGGEAATGSSRNWLKSRTLLRLGHTCEWDNTQTECFRYAGLRLLCPYHVSFGRARRRETVCPPRRKSSCTGTNDRAMPISLLFALALLQLGAHLFGKLKFQTVSGSRLLSVTLAPLFPVSAGWPTEHLPLLLRNGVSGYTSARPPTTDFNYSGNRIALEIHSRTSAAAAAAPASHPPPAPLPFSFAAGSSNGVLALRAVDACLRFPLRNDFLRPAQAPCSILRRYTSYLTSRIIEAYDPKFPLPPTNPPLTRRSMKEKEVEEWYMRYAIIIFRQREEPSIKRILKRKKVSILRCDASLRHGKGLDSGLLASI